MDKEQFYLKLVEEECTEIAQVCSKAIRFGIDNHPPNNPETTNRLRLQEEYNDLLATFTLLAKHCGIEVYFDNKLIAKKLEKVEKFKQYSIELNKLKE